MAVLLPVAERTDNGWRRDTGGLVAAAYGGLHLVAETMVFPEFSSRERYDFRKLMVALRNCSALRRWGLLRWRRWRQVDPGGAGGSGYFGGLHQKRCNRLEMRMERARRLDPDQLRIRLMPLARNLRIPMLCHPRLRVYGSASRTLVTIVGQALYGGNGPYRSRCNPVSQSCPRLTWTRITFRILWIRLQPRATFGMRRSPLAASSLASVTFSATSP